MIKATSGPSVFVPDEQQNVNFDRETQAEEIEDIKYEAFKFSYNYFSNGISTLFNGCPGIQEYINYIKELNIGDKLRQFSKLYNDISTIPVYKDSLEKFVKEERPNFHILNRSLTIELGDFILNIIKDSYTSSNENEKHVLYMEGPIGCYKNRLLQYVYLHLVQDVEIKQPVFYIDFAKYEFGNKERDADMELNRVKEVVNKKGITPLFIFDNIRGFVCSDKLSRKYEIFKSLEQTIRCKIIVSRDVDFNRISDRNVPLQFGAENLYKNIIKLSSLNMARGVAVTDFIKNFVTIFEQVDGLDNNNSRLKKQFYTKDKGWDYDKLKGYLNRLGLDSIDAYQLRKILQIINKFSDRTISQISISDIYIGFCNELGLLSSDNVNIDEKAFKFDYTNDKVSLDGSNITVHKSVLDYMIARYYVSKILEDIDKTEDERKYNLPNVTFPKSVTRFIVPELRNHTQIKDYIKQYFEKNCNYADIKKNFGRLTTFAYILGRLSKCDANENKTILSYYSACVANVDWQDDDAKMFLERSLLVSLIYQGDEKALIKYVELLIGSDNSTRKATPRDVNIGFHLDYYGDAKCAFKMGEIPRYARVNIDRCKNTLRKLSIDLEKVIIHNTRNQNQETYLIAILQLVTCCQIIEKLRYKLDKVVPNQDFLEKIIELLLKVVYHDKQRYSNCLNDKVITYLQNVLCKLIKVINRKECTEDKRYSDLVALYNKFSDLYRIGRAGWISRGLGIGYVKGRKIHNIAESVAEHTYNCLLMGYLFLPETKTYAKTNSEYNKEEVLELILLHDLGEIRSGDLTPNQKRQHPEKKEEQEKIMQRLTQKLDKKEVYEKWIDAENNDEPAIISAVAKDIDHIQAVYQFLCYYKNDQSVEEIQESLKEWFGKLFNKNNNPEIKKLTENLISESKTIQEGKIEKSLDEWLNELSGGIKSELGKKIRKYLIYENERFINVKDEKSMNLLYKLYEIKQRTSQQ